MVQRQMDCIRRVRGVNDDASVVAGKDKQPMMHVGAPVLADDQKRVESLCAMKLGSQADERCGAQQLSSANAACLSSLQDDRLAVARAKPAAVTAITQVR